MWGAAAFVPVIAVAFWRISHSPLSPESVAIEVGSRPPPAAPLCPWRQPDRDLQAFFPTATGCERETRILSGLRLELAERLGRPPTGEENSLPLYRVQGPGGRIGTILVRRVKGEYGAIEIVVAVDADGKVRGVRLQRLREPKAIADALADPAWLGSFRGQTAISAAESARELSVVPPAARISGQAVVDGVRGVLVLLAAAEKSGLSAAHTAH